MRLKRPNRFIRSWKYVVGYEGLYEVSTDGKVRSCDRWVKGNYGSKQFRKGKYLKLNKCKNGYLKVILAINKKNKTYLVHRLVATAFIPNSLNKEQVDHIDTDRTNNNVNNLRWVTSKENQNNPLTKKHKSGENHPMYGKRGELSPNYGKHFVRSEEQKQKLSKQIYCIELNKIWTSMTKCAEELKVSISYISRCCKKGIRCKGYTLRFL